MCSSWLQLTLKSFDLSRAEKKMTVVSAEQISKRQLTMRRNLLNWCNLVSINVLRIWGVFTPVFTPVSW